MLTQVNQHMKSGMTVIQACRKVGVPRSYIGARGVPYGVSGTWGTNLIVHPLCSR
jgi:hypothetical protein